ncbi:MAG TPA: GTPase Era [Alphaproteobacteria bacterium]
MTDTKCGYVALIGAPNAGKSELINKLTGQKISIVSPKVQTTRTRVLGIVTDKNVQAIFIDTPGLFKPRRRLDRAMVAAAHTARDEADIIALIVDVGRKDAAETATKLASRIPENAGQQKVLILNKIDLIARDKLLPLTATLNDRFAFDATFMISALKGSGVSDFLAYVQKTLPEAPYLYDEEIASDTPDRILAAEIVREKLYLRLHEELPYGLQVKTEKFDERDDKTIAIYCQITTSEARHKGMIIGKGGAQLKIVGQLAREELEHIFETKVHLFLDVAVQEGWDESREEILQLGLNPDGQEGT